MIMNLYYKPRNTYGVGPRKWLRLLTEEEVLVSTKYLIYAFKDIQVNNVTMRS